MSIDRLHAFTRTLQYVLSLLSMENTSMLSVSCTEWGTRSCFQYNLHRLRPQGPAVLGNEYSTASFSISRSTKLSVSFL